MWEYEEDLAISTVILMAAFGTKTVHSASSCLVGTKSGTWVDHNILTSCEKIFTLIPKYLKNYLLKSRVIDWWWSRVI